MTERLDIYTEVTDIASLKVMVDDWENLDQAAQTYIECVKTAEFAWLLAARVARLVRDQMGKPGITELSVSTQRSRGAIQAEAQVSDIEWLLESRPGLSSLHLDAVRRMNEEDACTWVDAAADNDWSPAELRRAIRLSRYHDEDARSITRKARTASERMKVVIDAAAKVSVLDIIADRVQSVVAHLQNRIQENGGDGNTGGQLPPAEAGGL